MISSMRGGGSERQTLLLLKHLDRQRFAPHLYVTERAGELMASVPDDVPVHCFSDCQPTGDEKAGGPKSASRKTGKLYFPGRVLRQQVAHLRSLVTDQSIDVIYDRTFHMTLIAGQLRNIDRVSTIVSPPELALPLVESRFVGLKRRRLARGYHRSKAVVAVSEQSAQSARRYYGLGQRQVQVIHNPIDIDAIRQAAKAELSEPIERDESLTLACVGRMSSEKGHADLIDALAVTESTWPSDRPTITVWMIGDGPLRQQLASQAETKLSKHRVKFLGARRDAAALIQAANALVLPSHFEGLPNVVLEAMAIGTPVIATRAGGTVELQRDEPTILWADPMSPASLAQTILAFSHESPSSHGPSVDRSSPGPNAVSKRVSAAMQLVESHHDVRKTIKRIESLLS
tara:strand:- start:757668 stop:758873 length:1206 start_codon:yes stop_codon:yes gene_type:complete